MSTIVQCACKKKLRAGPKLAGKRVKCPNCGNTIQIPGLSAPLPSSQPKPKAAAKPKPATVPPSPPSTGNDDPLFDSLDDDFEFGFQDDDLEPPKKKSEFTKPNFHAAAAPIPAPTKTKAKRKKNRSAKASQFAALLLGSFLACIGAVLGIILWFVVLLTTGFEIGWLWWGVGALVGIGMQLGVRESADDELAGIFAALIAFGAFALVKGGLTLLVSAGGGTVADVMSPSTCSSSSFR